MAQPAFDPDQYLKEKASAGPVVAQNTVGGFDPDKYLAEKTGQAPGMSMDQFKSQLNEPFQAGNALKGSGINQKGLVQGTLNTLPMAGMMAGGALGSPGGPLLAVGAAGAGGALGEELKSLGEQHLLGQQKTLPEVYKKQLGGFVSGVTSEGIGQGIQSGIKKYGAKIAHTLSGVPEKEIETYAQNADKINEMSKSADHNVQEMADQMRSQFNSDIQTKKDSLNQLLNEGLAKHGEKSVDLKPVIQALEEQKSRIDGRLYPEQLENLNGVINKVNKMASTNNLMSSSDLKIPVKDLNKVKGYLQTVAQPSYGPNGVIYSMGDRVASAAKSGAAVTRDLINKAAPEIAEANNGHWNLHEIEDVMNRNLLAEGKTASPLLAAGSAGNLANEKVLKQLGNLTDTNMIGDARNLAAARTFGNPGLLPTDVTGKANLRALISLGLGSPATIKTVINNGQQLMQPQVMSGLLQGARRTKNGLLKKDK